MTSYARFTALICFCFLPSLWGCAILMPSPPVHSPEVAGILDRIITQNESINTVNGLANATLTDKNGKTRYRLAWATQKPDHLRLIVLFSGKPVETVLYDGTHLSVTSHTKAHDPLNHRVRNPNLEKLIALPLKADRLISLLSASIPVKAHRTARLEKTPQGGFTLTLYKRNNKPVQVFHLDENKRPLLCEFEEKKHLQYRMDFAPFDSGSDTQPSLPREILIRRKDQSLHLRIDQIHPNPALSPDTFKMTTK